MSGIQYNRQKPFRVRGLLVVFMLIGAVAAPEARAEDTPLAPLRPYLEKVARQVVGYARGHDVKRVAVGQITAPAWCAANASEGIEKILIEELSKAGPTPERGAFLEIKGEYSLERDDKCQPRSAGLLFRLVDTSRAGPAKKEISVHIAFSDIDAYKLRTMLSTMFGINMKPVQSPVLTVSMVKEEVQKAVADTEKTPEANDDLDQGTFVEKSGPYGVQLEVKNASGEYRPRRLKRSAGLLYIDLKPEETFRVVLLNSTGDEAAVQVLMDGIDVLEFSKSAGRRFLVSPRSHQEVEGWISQNDQRVHEFQVKKFGESVFATRGRANHANLGMITVRFSKCFVSDGKPKGSPAEELPSHAIGRGTEKPVQVKEYRRWVDPGDALIHVRYRISSPAAEKPAGV
jgi:hypothetical protein